jgi:ubiquinone/menaquinone biosynthesis C-methylase UbiE
LLISGKRHEETGGWSERAIVQAMKNGNRPLDKNSIKRFYDWLGEKLDTQSFYEQSGLDVLAHHGQFDSAHAVFEFGCGTGRLAEQLFREYLPPDCHYSATDISPNMAAITRERLKPWEGRTSIMVSAGGVGLDYGDARFDRFICTYVIDLLNDTESFKLMGEAYRVLQPDGLLCLVSITPGVTFLSRIMMRTWQFINKLNPILTGGCRPVRLRRFVQEKKWSVVYHQVLSKYGVAIEIVIARRR